MKEANFLSRKGLEEQEAAIQSADAASQEYAAENAGMLAVALGTTEFTPTQQNFTQKMAEFRAGEKPKACAKGYSGFRIPYEGREPNVK